MIFLYDEAKSKLTSKKEELLKKKGVNSQDKAFGEDKAESDVEEMPIRQDDFITGHYVIGGIEYIYSEGNEALTQKITLLRREWPTRANNL